MLIIINLRHAPRERVSWNFDTSDSLQIWIVTLHVSVWVEMAKFSENV